MSSISRDDDIMNTGVEANPPLDKRNREMRPERIEVGDEVLERNDIIAKRFGESVRAFNKRDRDGAPYLFVAGTKYRPVGAFNAYIKNSVRRQKPLQQPKRRRTR
jgi:hypothetical protein